MKASTSTTTDIGIGDDGVIPVALRPLTWSDRLLLLSPKLWFGFLLQFHNNPFLSVRLDQLWQSFLGAFLPLLVVAVGATTATSSTNNNNMHTSPNFLLTVILLTCLSPWTMASLYSGIPPLYQIYQTSSMWYHKRNNPLPSALACLKERIETERCISCQGYHVYLPPTSSTNTSKQHALLLLPGALIAHTAYAELAAQLSDEGILVVVVSMEPTRMAFPYLGADLGRMQRIIQQVTMRRVDDTVSRVEWAIAGHSLGSFAAMRLVLPLRDSLLSLHNNKCHVSQLVLWASSAKFPHLRTNLSNESDLQVLILQGSNDPLCAIPNDETRQAWMADFPSSSSCTTVQTIAGASHNWFASLKVGDNPAWTGIPTISMTKQHYQIVQRTARFVLHARGSNNKT